MDFYLMIGHVSHQLHGAVKHAAPSAHALHAELVLQVLHLVGLYGEVLSVARKPLEEKQAAVVAVDTHTRRAP